MTTHHIKYHKYVQLLFAHLEEYERQAVGEYVNWRDILVAVSRVFKNIHPLPEILFLGITSTKNKWMCAKLLIMVPFIKAQCGKY